MNVKCPCPECGSILSVPEERLGQTGPCRVCGKTIHLPDLRVKCPSCGVLIYVPNQREGLSGRCNKCGASITLIADGDGLALKTQQQVAEETGVEHKSPQVQETSKAECREPLIGLVGLMYQHPIWILVTIALLVFVVVASGGPQGLKEGIGVMMGERRAHAPAPLSSAVSISTFILVVATSIWAARDARKIELHKYRVRGVTSEMTTLLGCLLFWIVFFPWYLVNKGKIQRGEARLKEEFAESDRDLSAAKALILSPPLPQVADETLPQDQSSRGLILCGMCKHSVSPLATICPECGHPLNSASEPGRTGTGLIACRGCGQGVHYTAKICPHCGVKDPGAGSFLGSIGDIASGGMRVSCGCLLLVLLLPFLLLVWFIVFS